MSEENNHDTLTNETLFLGIQTQMLMMYILTGNKKLKKAIDLADFAWALTKIYG